LCKQFFLIVAFLFLGSLSMAEELPQVSTSKLERLENFPSRFVAPRHVDVWLPPGYSQGGRYSVIYMHDGQMLFDAQTTWNKQAWQVDVTVARLIKEGRIPPTIVVGIWNNGKYRHAEYFPQKHLDYLPPASRDKLIAQALEGKPMADAYLRFLVEELKPAIDRKYATQPAAAHTFVMGSSMGGLISVYAMSEYPQVFGGAAGLSTHWVGSHQANATLPLAAFNYLRDHLAAPEGHRLYQDHGTTELDALYAPYQRFVDEIVRERGYTQTNFMSRTFENEGHNEMAWAKRLEIPLVFLMGNGAHHD
jgi:enterochelin esterase-like enzyme